MPDKHIKIPCPRFSVDAKKIGVLAILAASVIWAVEAVLARLTYSYSDVVSTAAARAFLVVPVALIYAALTAKGALNPGRKALPAIAYVVVMGTLVGDLVYYFALGKTSLLNAVLLGHLQPVLITLLGFLILRGDRLNRYDYAGIGLMLLAGTLVATRTVENLLGLHLGTIGDLYVLAATAAWATTAIAARKYLTALNAGVLTLWRYAIASAAFALYLAARGIFFVPSFTQLTIGVLVGIGTILYYEGLKRIKAAQVGALELSTPLFGAILGLTVFGEAVTGLQVLGIAVLVAGVLLLSKRERA